MSDPLGKFEAMPRKTLAHTPTPIEAMTRLTDDVGGAELWVKRDDCTGLAFGGNKIRQLEFYLGAALAQNADTLLITGAVQSNYVRSTAAAAAKCGLACHVQLEERVKDPSATYRTSGNVLLDKLLGATLHSYPDGEDEAGADRKLTEIAADLRRNGAAPFIVPLSPGHPPVAALGYIVCAREILEQCAGQEVEFDEIVVASGSGNTHAGLLYGLRAMGDSTPVRGVCVRRTADQQAPRIAARCQQIADLLEAINPVAEDDVWVDDAMLAPGYGRLNAAVIDAIRCAARREALLVDPVYTGRVFAAAMSAARHLPSDKRILVIHTGGAPALFAYEAELSGCFDTPVD